MPSLMTIELKNLHFYASHGWHAEEALTGNEFLVDIIASFVPEEAMITDLHSTINYVEVYEMAKATFAEPEKLLETIAMKIGEKVFQKFPQLKEIKISITKLQAPIEGFSGTVGINFLKSF